MRHSMKMARRATWLVPAFVLAALPLGNCGTAEPPLDQLELRDALLSEPAVIAALPREAQQRLAGRFWAAVALPESEQSMPPAETSAPEQRLRRLDAQRQQRGQDAFLIGIIGRNQVAETLRPFYRSARSSPTAPLPPLGGLASSATQAQEARALAGRAGAAIEDLRNVSGAGQLERVIGWPTAVLAMDDKIYINATWLTAVAALEPGEPLGPAQGGAQSLRGGATAGRSTLLYGGIYALPGDEHGAIGQHVEALSADPVDPAAPPSEDPAASGGFGSCSSCSSSSCNSSSCNSSSSSCNSSSSSCNSSSSNCNVNLCSSSADKECCRACALAPTPARPDLSLVWMTLWLSLPLLFLGSVDLRTRVRARVGTRDGRAAGRS